jgi:hypothetical protein
MSLARTAVWCLVVLLILVPTVRLAPGAADDVSHEVVTRTFRCGADHRRHPSVATVLPILTPRGFDVPGAGDRALSADPVTPFVPPRG